MVGIARYYPEQVDLDGQDMQMKSIVRPLRGHTFLNSMSPALGFSGSGSLPCKSYGQSNASSELATLPFSTIINIGEMLCRELTAINAAQKTIMTEPASRSPFDTNAPPYQNPWTNIAR